MKGGEFGVYYPTKAYKEVNTGMIYKMLWKMAYNHKPLNCRYFNDLGYCDEANDHQVPR